MAFGDAESLEGLLYGRVLWTLVIRGRLWQNRTRLHTGRTSQMKGGLMSLAPRTPALPEQMAREDLERHCPCVNRVRTPIVRLEPDYPSAMDHLKEPPL